MLPHIRDLSTSNSQPVEDGSKPCSISRRALVLGAIGLFISLFGTIQQYVEGTTGIAIGLLVAGVVVLALALIVSRLTSPSRWCADRGPTPAS